MFRGIYNGKQYHVADIPAVLSRAWSAGVDRIIVNSSLRRLFSKKFVNFIVFFPDYLSCFIRVPQFR